NGLLENFEDYQEVNFSADIQDLQIGKNFTCFLSNGDVYCFGNNLNGQLGLSSKQYIYSIPTQLEY
ncbi:hypothetical protein MJH12_03940, partial [bacterium]|nr:hypothetical protein [bacterium]